MSLPDNKLSPPATHLIPRRAAAVIIDSIVVGFLYLVLWLGLVGTSVSDYIPSVQSPLPGLVPLALLIAYYVLFEGAFGASPGKLVTGLRVVDRITLGKPNLAQALIRNLLRPVDALAGYVVAAIVAEASPYRQRIGDHAARTLVVDSHFREHIEETEGLERRKKAGARAEQHVSHELHKLAAFDGDYWVWNDLYEDGAGNIDHLVTGPGGMTIVETKSHRGVVRVEDQGPPTVDGRPLERDVLKQVQNQRRAVVRRMGLGATDPDQVKGFNWIICFARGQLASDLHPHFRRRLATTRDLRGKIRSQPRTATPEQVLSMAHAIEGLYGREPDHSPSGPGKAEPDGPAQARPNPR
ncbi:hypothetical protein BH20ACT11_BH20ACT11_05410 [soil metagenome]